MEGIEITRDFEIFVFAFIRTFAILAVLPFFGGRNVPFMVKVGMAFFLAIMVTPLIKQPVPSSDLFLASGFFREVLIGMAIGFVVRVLFAGIEMAGQMTGIQMGYGVATVIDPQTSSQLSVFAQLFNIVAILVFFSMGMHLVLLRAIRESFAVIPPYGFHISPGFFDGILTLAGRLFVVALKFAAPIMVTILLINIALGIIARVIPQMNVFIIGFPITIGAGLIVFLFVLPFFVGEVGRIYHRLSGELFDLLRVLGG